MKVRSCPVILFLVLRKFHPILFQRLKMHLQVKNRWNYLSFLKHKQKIMKIIKCIACYLNRKKLLGKKKNKQVDFAFIPASSSRLWSSRQGKNLIPLTGDQRQVVKYPKTSSEDIIRPCKAIPARPRGQTPKSPNASHHRNKARGQHPRENPTALCQHRSGTDQGFPHRVGEPTLSITQPASKSPPGCNSPTSTRKPAL